MIAATGTGKTVVAAFDFRQFFEKRNRRARLLFVAHRREILEQAVVTFRNVLRMADFGELLVGPYEATRMEHLFCSVDMLTSRRRFAGCPPTLSIDKSSDKKGTDFYEITFHAGNGAGWGY